MDQSLKIEHLSKHFAETTVLSDLNVEIPQGSFTCVLGPSGSGKTTLLMLLAGIEKVSKGRIFFGDEDITDIALEKRKAGIVFQNYALFPNLTVKENILYGLPSNTDSEKRQETLQRLTHLTNLQGLENRFPNELSGGQQQRVAIARALAVNPRFLLLDEPLSALDANNRTQIGLQLRQIQRKANITTIMVTHDQAEAMSLSDFIVIIKDGKIEQAGSPKEIFDHPATPFAAAFAGGMNLLKTLRVNDGKLTGIRHTDVEVREATEGALHKDHTFVAELQSMEFSGSFVVGHFLMNDFKTQLTAVIPRTNPIADELTIGSLYALRLPIERWHTWRD